MKEHIQEIYKPSLKSHFFKNLLYKNVHYLIRSISPLLVYTVEFHISDIVSVNFDLNKEIFQCLPNCDFTT